VQNKIIYLHYFSFAINASTCLLVVILNPMKYIRLGIGRGWGREWGRGRGRGREEGEREGEGESEGGVRMGWGRERGRAWVRERGRGDLLTMIDHIYA
jgi:hypothetical protein